MAWVAAAAQVQFLAQEILHAVGAAKKRERERDNNDAVFIAIVYHCPGSSNQCNKIENKNKRVMGKEEKS